MTYGGCAPFGGGGPFPLGGGGPFPFAGGGAWRSVIHYQLMNWWTVTNALNRLLKIFWMLWDDGYPGGGTDKLLTEGMETTPSAWGTGEAACEAINPTKEIRTTIVNLAMFTTFLLNNRMRVNKYHNRHSNKYTKAARKTERKSFTIRKNFSAIFMMIDSDWFRWKEKLEKLYLDSHRLAPDLWENLA